MPCGSPHRFGDAALERSFQRQQREPNRAIVSHLLGVQTAMLLLVGLNHLLNPDLTLVLAVLAAFFALCLQALLLYRSHRGSERVEMALVAVWTAATLGAMFVQGSQTTLLPSVVAYFAVYTIYPFELWTSVGLGVTLSCAQTLSVVLATLPDFYHDQFLATLLVHTWAHFVGIYLFVTRSRLCRAAFLNARNAILCAQNSHDESLRMNKLLSSSLPSHVISSALQSQIGTEVPHLYVQHYTQATVVFARFTHLDALLAQISVQDGARLLNEFNSRIDQIAQRNACVRVQSSGILVVSGIPSIRGDHARLASQFACELRDMLRSFCDSTTADLNVQVGIASGPISAGIVGVTKWHYDIIGDAVDEAIALQEKSFPGVVLLSDDTKRLVEGEFPLDRRDGGWSIVPGAPSQQGQLPHSLLFPNQRRFSLVTVPQAINRLLQAIAASNESTTVLLGGRRKRKFTDPPRAKMDDLTEENESKLIHKVTLRFKNDEAETGFHIQMDRWFIPALAISIFFLVVYGIFHVLVLPRQITTLVVVIIALMAMFVILLMLYINFFQSFCQFITRTAAGHSVAILLIVAMLFTCGIVNTFSCPAYDASSVCHVVHYSMVSCALWMLTATVFVRFGSLYLAGTLLAGIATYSVHIFVTHSDLYYNYSKNFGLRVEVDLLVGLLSLAATIYLQARRNERMIRFDYLAVLKTLEERARLERYEFLNERILFNTLPGHIACNFFQKADPYSHLSHSVGVVSIRIQPKKSPGDAQLSADGVFDRLNAVVVALDALLARYPGIEKLCSWNGHYSAAVGVLPEVAKNVHDPPSTIGDLLASLTNFALAASEAVEERGCGVHCGIDCGAALSVVLGAEAPVYDVFGPPVERSRLLMEAAGRHRVLVSEEIYLALRPRDFKFDHDRPVVVNGALKAYVFRREPEPGLPTSFRLDDTRSLVSLPGEETTSTGVGITQNPLDMLSSMTSSLASGLYSIDVGVETDSEMEWITPDMIARENRRRRRSSSASLFDANRNPKSGYKGALARQYSELSDAEEGVPGPPRRGHFSLTRNGPRLPAWLSSQGSFQSDASLLRSQHGSLSALDRLNAAANRVDRMLRELATVDGFDNGNECAPFPTALSASTRSMADRRRELSSACHTEYDNADSDAVYSDSEMIGSYRLDDLKRVLKGNVMGTSGSSGRRRRKGSRGRPPKKALVDTGNDADVDSICSSLASSRMFSAPIRGRSVRSIGYEDEYEIATDPELEEISARCEMEALSRDIRRNFGDYELATFEHIDA
uniref:adenylate cyclase n=1 Tax=Steinernema glaseri TaxID=37863 RepID=A0A1I8AS51_9BILA